MRTSNDDGDRRAVRDVRMAESLPDALESNGLARRYTNQHGEGRPRSDAA